MPRPIFTVVTTAKNEKNKDVLRETFENWERATEPFGRSVEFIVVDAGGNTELPSTDLFSTGTDLDHEYVTELDAYDNWFEVMYQAFKRKNIVAATPSLRPRDSRKISRRFAAMGLNTLTRMSLKLPSISVQDTIMVGGSVPGCSIAMLREIAAKLTADGTGPYDPELAIGEDYELSRRLGMCGKVSYEKKAGIFVRTLSRVSSGFDITKSLVYALKWAPHYLFPGRYCKYQKHTLSM